MTSHFDAAEEVRQAMLDSLGVPTPGRSSTLCLRIKFAGDLQQLWHLRGELMQALALMRGEAWASDKLAQMSPLFGEALPRGWTRRMSRGQLRA